MPVSTKYSNPQSPLTTREKSSSTRRNAIDAYFVSSLNTLDDDINRLEQLVGISADNSESDIVYSSTRVVSNATDLITAIGALDAAMAINASIVETSRVNLTGTVSVSNNSKTFTVDTGTDVVTCTAHGLISGQPFSAATSNTLPGGLSAGSVYYAGTITSNTFKVYPTAADAAAETNAINITTTGTGTHNLDGTVLHGDTDTVFLTELNANSHVYIPGLGGRKHFQISSVDSDSKATLVDAVTETNTAENFKQLIRVTDPLTFEEAPISETDAVYNNELVRFSQISSLAPATLYLSPKPIVWTNASTVQIPAGWECRDDTDAQTISFAGDTSVVLSSSGANGRDTGSEANNTWYYLWAIDDSSGANSPAGLLSASSTSPTMPTGYDLKRRTPIAVRNNNSGNLIEFTVREGWPYRPRIEYLVDTSYYSGSWQNGTNNVLSNGTATSATDVDVSSLVPPTSEFMHGHLLNYGNTAIGYIELNEKSGNHKLRFNSGSSGAVVTSHQFSLKTDSNQVIQYKNTTIIGTGIDVTGFTVTEVI